MSAASGRESSRRAHPSKAPPHASSSSGKHRAAAEWVPAFDVPEGMIRKALGKGRYLVSDSRRGYVVDLSVADRVRVELVFRRPRAAKSGPDEQRVAMSRFNRERRWVTTSDDETHRLTVLHVDQSIQSPATLRELLPKAFQFLDGVAQELPKALQGRPLHAGQKKLQALGTSAQLPTQGALRLASARDRMRALLAAEGTTGELDKDGDFVFVAPTGLRMFVAQDNETPEFLRVATQLPHDGDGFTQRASCNQANLSVPLCKCVALDDKTTSLNAEQMSPASSNLSMLKSVALTSLQACRAAYERALATAQPNKPEGRIRRLRVVKMKPVVAPKR